MSAVIEAYDKALHAAPAPSVHMAQRLLTLIRRELASGTLSREDIYACLEQLYDHYAESGCTEEREAVADVLDAFDGWAPLKAVI